jgi:membrane-bound serine protease (ClpP class)
LINIDMNWFHVDLWVIILVIIAIIAFIAIAVIWGVRAHHHQAFAGREDLIGKIAEVEVALEPKGVVLVEGERWAAVSEKGRVEPGEEVVINQVDRLKLWVTKKE